MKRIPLLSLLVAVGATLSACMDHNPTAVAPESSGASAARASAQGSSETTGNHLVLFKAERIPGDFAARIARAGGRIESAIDPVGIAVVSGLSAAEAARLRQDREIESVIVERTYRRSPPQIESTLQAEMGTASVEAPQTAQFFPRQWHLRVIQAHDAWEAGFLGSPDVTVAIIDSGLDYTHPDLAGLVDLSRSVSFVPQDDALVQAFFPGAHPVADLDIHGTHVGATVSSNAAVAAGVTSKTTLMGVKVCGVTVGCPWGAFFNGVVHAVDNGADAINISLGIIWDFSADPSEARLYKEFFKFYQRTMWYARQHNVTVVASAGNESTLIGVDPLQITYNCDGVFVLCISATGPTASAGVNGPWVNVDAFAPYSNYGPIIDFAAPGGNSGGAVWAACSRFSLVVPVCRTGVFILGISGTSMAAPHVTGVVAAMSAAQRYDGHAVIKRQMALNADQIGHPWYYGHGRINMYKSLTNNRFVD